MAKSIFDKSRWNKIDAQGEVRQKFELESDHYRSDDKQKVLKVRADGTVVVDTEGKYRVVKHTGKICEKTGVEIVTILHDLVPISTALMTLESYNGRWYRDQGYWAEILTYDKVYAHENGELDAKRVRKRKWVAKSRKNGIREPRIAKVG